MCAGQSQPIGARHIGSVDDLLTYLLSVERAGGSTLDGAPGGSGLPPRIIRQCPPWLMLTASDYNHSAGAGLTTWPSICLAFSAASSS
jgi:hypothetical protein